MRGIVHILFADGDRSRHPLDEPPPLEWFQGKVGGYLGRIPHLVQFEGNKCIAFFNEEGGRLNLPINVEATQLWRRQVGNMDISLIRGDVIVVTGDQEFMEEL